MITDNKTDYYHPYGKILREWNPQTEKYLTTQHERDTETGLDYRGARGLADYSGRGTPKSFNFMGYGKGSINISAPTSIESTKRWLNQKF